MKCLVFSDSHGCRELMVKALKMNKDADAVFFLGDGLSDAESAAMRFPDTFWIAVRGNCDASRVFMNGIAERLEEITLEGRKIIAVHGDAYGVKGGTDKIIDLAKERKVDIVLFGHTHSAHESYCDGIYFFNPGSISSRSASFGILTLTETSVLFSVGKLQ